MPENNLIVTIPGRAGSQPIALAAHLDKINHYGEGLKQIPARAEAGKLIGAMDDSVGVGICLAMARRAAQNRWPPLWLLFSEMEESFGLSNHPERLRHSGKGLAAGMGAQRIAESLRSSGRSPAAVVVIDTTPLFRGQPGCALYCEPWELAPMTASPALREATAIVRDQLLALDPELEVHNNENDYLEYAVHFNLPGLMTVPCLALEPSIGPYHQRDEQVYVADLERIVSLLSRWLTGPLNH
ncbi:MAG: M28 family peptidase [Planctomycetaceae bacterium]